MGKTVALEHFARQEAASCEPAFCFSSEDLVSGHTIFIDAIDEVSIQEAVNIAKGLRRTPAVRWRVSCRAEDWNAGGKLSRAFGSELAALDVAPVVAQLQPLSEEEVVAVLGAFGCSNPVALLATLQALRSTPFVMTPLGLKFLMSVKPERLPSITRFELYESGALHFASEHNQTKAEDVPDVAPTPHVVLDYAGRIFLTLLLAGKHGLQRSSLAEGTTLATHEVGLDGADRDIVLDTALFIKKGEDFLPFHRSIQEFLAGRYLARLVTGGLGDARLHIERAVALLVSADGLASEGLKALYAWFTCHLVNEGALHEAKRLVERDPETLLLHGDAAKLPLASRLVLLKDVGSRDPFFRWTPDQWGPAQICTVGLITPDLSEMVIDLLQSENSAHRLSMMLEALSAGPPLAGTAEACWSIVLRQSAAQWCRQEAVTAWLHCAAPSVAGIWARIDELRDAGEQQSGNLRTIAQLFCAIPSGQLAVADVDKVLASLQRVDEALSKRSRQEEGRVAGVAYAIRDIAWHVAIPHLWRPLILDAPKRWRLQAGVGSQEHKFASVLCIAVMSSHAVTVTEFAHMMVATGLITGAESTFKKAAEEWLAGRKTLDDVLQALLFVMNQDVADSGSMAMGLHAIGLKATDKLVNQMLSAELLIASVGAQYVGRQVSTWTLQRGKPAPVWLIPLLDESPASATVEAVLEGVRLHAEEELELQAHHLDSVEHRLIRQIVEWQLESSSVAAGEVQDALYWGAEIYCGSRPIASVRVSGVEALQEVFGDSLAQPVLMGLAGVMATDEQVEHRGVVTAASASILLESGQDLSSVPTPRILQILFAAGSMRDAYLQTHLESYCIERLSQSLTEDPHPLHQLADRKDANWTLLLYKLGDYAAHSALHAWAAQTALEQPDRLTGRLLDSVLRLAELNLDEVVLTPLISEVLHSWSEQDDGGGALTTSTDPQCADRLRWTYFGVCLRPDLFSGDFARALAKSDDFIIHRVIVEGYPQRGYWRTPTSTSTLAVSCLLLQFLFQRNPLMQGYFERLWPDTVKVLKAISLSEEPGVEAALLELVAHAEGTRWIDTIRHELELYRRDVRSQTQKLVSARDLSKVLDGKGPIDAQDLKALVLIVLEEIAADMQPSPHNPWKLFWDNNAPKVENDCRDVLAGKLRDKLGYFGSFEVLCEAASSGGTRADMLITHGNLAVPIEAKRTNHSHLWYGHSGQLQTYSLANSTTGQGIYVIFWFGKALGVTLPPAGPKPTTAEALKAALENHLPPELVATTSVLVLDVSDAAKAAKLRKNSDRDEARASKPQAPKKTRSRGAAADSTPGKKALKVPSYFQEAPPPGRRGQVTSIDVAKSGQQAPACLPNS